MFFARQRLILLFIGIISAFYLDIWLGPQQSLVVGERQMAFLFFEYAFFGAIFALK